MGVRPLVLSSINRLEGLGNAFGNKCNRESRSRIKRRRNHKRSHHGVNGLLVPPGDEKSLAETVINLLKDEGSLHEMGLNGRKIAEAHDWKKIAKKTEELYREILEDN